LSSLFGRCTGTLRQCGPVSSTLSMG
jgi:hypothetical protein